MYLYFFLPIIESVEVAVVAGYIPV